MICEVKYCQDKARYHADADRWLCDACYVDYVNMKLDEAWSFEQEL